MYPRTLHPRTLYSKTLHPRTLHPRTLHILHPRIPISRNSTCSRTPFLEPLYPRKLPSGLLCILVTCHRCRHLSLSIITVIAYHHYHCLSPSVTAYPPLSTCCLSYLSLSATFLSVSVILLSAVATFLPPCDPPIYSYNPPTCHCHCHDQQERRHQVDNDLSSSITLPLVPMTYDLSDPPACACDLPAFL